MPPHQMPPARLAALAKLPVFLDLHSRRVVVMGGGDPVVWKAELLAAAGAHVDIYAADPGPALVALSTAHATIGLHRRAWTAADLGGAMLVVADAHDASEAARVRDAAHARGLLVNAIDNPDFCDFQFGTIVNRSPVVVGIMTDGAAPILGQAIRRRIEAVLPAALSSWARAAHAFRETVARRLPSRDARRLFWEGFVDRAFGPPVPETSQTTALEQLVAEVATRRSDTARIGEVLIVGAGPGDPELLTLKAMRALQAADVIVYDRLVTPEILELGRREARRVHVGKEGHGAACRQEDISALLVDLALAGETVVRLKGGDPSVFGRSGEEIEACRQAGVPFRIVPGITTASAAAASLAVSLTHRDYAQRLHFITGHDRTGRLPVDLDFRALADPRSTLVVYMGRRTAAALAQRLGKEGLDGDTPVVAVANVSRPDEMHVAGTLDALAQGTLRLPDDRPIIILVGRTLAAGIAAADTSARSGDGRRREYINADHGSADDLSGHAILDPHARRDQRDDDRPEYDRFHEPR